MTDTPTHTSWRGMLERCNNPNATNFKFYGGRGITVCHEWRDFRNFFADMGERPFESWTLERVDTNKNYEPDNCAWIPGELQARNTRQNVYVHLLGRDMIVQEALENLGVQAVSLYWRIKRYGETHQQAVDHLARRVGYPV